MGGLRALGLHLGEVDARVHPTQGCRALALASPRMAQQLARRVFLGLLGQVLGARMLHGQPVLFHQQGNALRACCPVSSACLDLALARGGELVAVHAVLARPAQATPATQLGLPPPVRMSLRAEAQHLGLAQHLLRVVQRGSLAALGLHLDRPGAAPARRR